MNGLDPHDLGAVRQALCELVSILNVLGVDSDYDGAHWTIASEVPTWSQSVLGDGNVILKAPGVDCRIDQIQNLCDPHDEASRAVAREAMEVHEEKSNRQSLYSPEPCNQCKAVPAYGRDPRPC